MIITTLLKIFNVVVFCWFSSQFITNAIIWWMDIICIKLVNLFLLILHLLLHKFAF